MKNIFLAFYLFICLFVFSALSGCHKAKDKTDVFIDSIQNTIPLSAPKACKMVESLLKDTVNMSKEQKMRLILTWINTLDRTDTAKLSIDKAKELVAYYSTESSNTHSLFLSYYYLAGAYRDHANYPMAVEWYKKTIQLHKENKSICTDSLLSKALFQLSYIYSDMLLPRCALECYKELLSLHISNDSKASALNSIGIVYQNMEMSDSASYFFEKSYNFPCSYIEKMKNGKSQLHFFVMRHDTINIRKRLPDLKVSSGSDSIFNSTLYESKAAYYEFINETDSALIYWKLLLHDDNVEYRHMAAEHLNNIASAQGDLHQAQQYSEIYQSLTDSIFKLAENKNIASVKQQFDYEVYRKQSEESEQRRIRSEYTIWIISLASLLVLLLLLAITCIFYIQKQKSKLKLAHLKQDLLQTKEKYVAEQNRIFTLSDNIEKLERQKEELQKNLGQSLEENKDNKERLEAIQKKCDQMNNEINMHINRENALQMELDKHYLHIKEIEDKANEQKFQAEEEWQELFNRLSKGQSYISKEDWNLLLDLTNKVYPCIQNHVREKCPGVQPQDLQIIYLTCCGFSNKRIMEMLTISYQLVNVRKKRICERITGKSLTAQESNAFIASFKEKSLLDLEN